MFKGLSVMGKELILLILEKVEKKKGLKVKDGQ